MRSWWKGAAQAVAAVAVLAMAGVTHSSAQQAAGAQRDPFAQRLGAVEAAFLPREALRQHELLDAALDGLAPQRPGRLDVYVIAAGLWGDHVFESEASRTAQALSDNFGARGRTVVLSAGGGPERTLPAANPNNLHIVLGRVGQLIDPDEDLVVVFLTSHGGPTGMALLEQNRMRGSLAPTALRAALDEAGIRQRVVIISACYSGIFVPALADDATVVLTAAARDRTSFGCQPEREWTYFGDAVVNQGLLAGKPLMQSFTDGLALITAWERRDGLVASNPQQHLGARALSLVEQAEAAAR
jgi:hypothetical protein